MTSTARIARLLNVRLLHLIACVLIFVNPAFGDTIYFGSATDATGDSTPAGVDDLVFASAAIDQAGFLTLVARFAPGSFLPQGSVAEFYFDLDFNPATGFDGNNEIAIVGTETRVSILFFNFGSATVATFNGTFFASQGPNYPFTTLTDGFSLTLPLLELGVTDGRLNFRVVSKQVMSFRGGPITSGIRDRLTDLNAPPVSTAAVPEPTSFSFLAIGISLLLLVCIASLIEFPPMSSR